MSLFIAGRDMGRMVADMRKRVDEHVGLEDGYHVEWSGEFENQQRAMARPGWVVPLSVLIIFVLLFDAFKDITSADLILALWLTGMPLSVSAAIGFIALFGHAVLNGVIMLSRFGQLREQGMALLPSMIEGSLQRLRTVLVTALLAMFGPLPMATSHAIQAETQKPLAAFVIGGLMSAMLLTLLVLPTLYYCLHRRREECGVRAEMGGCCPPPPEMGGRGLDPWWAGSLMWRFWGRSMTASGSTLALFA